MKNQTKLRKLHPRPENEFLDYHPTKRRINWEFVIAWGFIFGVIATLVYLITLL